MTEKQIYCLLFLYAYLNLYASILLLKKKNLTNKTKYFLMIVIWLVPFLGYIYVVHRIEKEKKEIANKNSILVGMDEKGNKYLRYIAVVIFIIIIFSTCK